MTNADVNTQPLLLIISDRPQVWDGFRSPVREVRRWVGERDSDQPQARSPHNFSGDPSHPDTYRWALKSPELSAVIDLQDESRAKGAIDALRVTAPRAAVLVITAKDDISAEQIEISRRLQWRDALRGDLEVELKRLEAMRRLTELRHFAAGDGDVPILVHPEPDPDAIASALAMRALLQRSPDRSPIITLGGMTRAENRRMAELLHMRVTEVTPEELIKLERVIAVDFQPRFHDPEHAPRLAVVDHHPLEGITAEFCDIRTDYGAVSTMMTEYLRLEDERRIDQPLATALLYGIKTDTDTLARECIAADVEAYAFLQQAADLVLLRVMARPSYSPETAQRYGEALANLMAKDDVALVFLGRIDESEAHVLAEIADFCLGLAEITWAVAAAVVDDKLVLTVRNLGGGEAGAGDLAKDLTQHGGNGGGHDTMARATLPIEQTWRKLIGLPIRDAAEILMREIGGTIETLRVSRRSSHPARPAKVRSKAT